MKCHPPMNLSLEIKGVVPAFPLWGCLELFFNHPLDRRDASLGHVCNCVAQWHKWEDGCGVSQCRVMLSGWLPDKDTGARAGPWLYLPGSESWSPAAQPHRQLLQKGAHWMCPGSHGEGKLYVFLKGSPFFCCHNLASVLFVSSLNSALAFIWKYISCTLLYIYTCLNKVTENIEVCAITRFNRTQFRSCGRQDCCLMVYYIIIIILAWTLMINLYNIKKSTGFHVGYFRW